MCCTKGASQWAALSQWSIGLLSLVEGVLKPAPDPIHEGRQAFKASRLLTKTHQQPLVFFGLKYTKIRGSLVVVIVFL